MLFIFMHKNKKQKLWPLNHKNLKVLPGLFYQ